MMMKTVLSFALLLTLPGFASNTFYVSPAGTHIPPFDSEATASTNIQNAVDLAADGDSVLILAGTYALASQITVSTAVEIVSASGPASTIIDGMGQSRCFWLANVASKLSGLTITNGLERLANGGGVYCENDGLIPVLTNCVVVGNTAVWGGGIDGTTAYDCDILNNHATEFGGGAEYATLHSCRIMNNTANLSGGGLDFSCIAHNCLILSNAVLTADDYGGGGASYSCSLFNCTVVGNTSAGDVGGVEGSHIYNSIVALNTAVFGIHDDIFDEFDGYVTLNTCSPDAPHGIDGNTTNDPAFMNFAAGEYSLHGASVCIDSGDAGYVSSGLDLIGNPRIVSGTVDMGAFEYQADEGPDGDGDGMDEAWERQYFFGDAVPSGNPDGDAYNNEAEFIAGTDPTNAASFFSITNVGGSPVAFAWPVIRGRQYSLLWTENMTNSFHSFGPPIYFPQNSYTDTVHNAESAGFYKVQVELLPPPS